MPQKKFRESIRSLIEAQISFFIKDCIVAFNLSALLLCGTCSKKDSDHADEILTYFGLEIVVFNLTLCFRKFFDFLL
jgi:hypothetical protein